jgi:hypothetical protein
MQKLEDFAKGGNITTPTIIIKKYIEKRLQKTPRLLDEKNYSFFEEVFTNGIEPSRYHEKELLEYIYKFLLDIQAQNV